EAQKHGRPPADAIRVNAEHDTADRSGDEACAECRKRQHQAAVFALRGKESVADLDRKEAVGDEIVEFEHVADGGGERGTNDVNIFVDLLNLWQSRSPRNLSTRLNIDCVAVSHTA